MNDRYFVILVSVFFACQTLVELAKILGPASGNT